MKQIHYTLCILAIILVSSCSPAYYGPSTMHLPSLEKKGDLVVSANRSRSKSDNSTVLESFGTDINVAYSPVDNIALTVGFNDFVNHNVSENPELDINNLTMGNLGIGYYAPINDKFSYEAYVDSNVGEFHGSRFTSEVSALTTKIGVKSGIAFKTKYTSILFGLGFYNLKYSNINGSSTRDVRYLEDHSSSLLREYSITFRAGTERIKGQWQFGRSSNMTHRDFLQTNSYTSFGLLVNLNVLDKL